VRLSLCRLPFPRSHAAGSFNLGTWLVVDDPLPKNLDVIFSFGGADERAPYAYELACKYPGSQLIVSGYNRADEKKKMAKLGADTGKIVFIDSCKSTWAETGFLESWVKNNVSHVTPNVSRLTSNVPRSTSNVLRPTSNVSLSSNVSRPTSNVSFTSNVSRQTSNVYFIGLISSPYHMRRIKMMMTRRNYKNIIPYYLPVPRERYLKYHYDYKKWWKNKDLKTFVIQEIGKITYFMFGLWK
jgi:hypothetical protein